MSESLRNDGRVWVPKSSSDTRKPDQIPDEDRDYYLERRYPAFGNMVPRDVASRAAKERCDAGFGVGESGKAVFLDFRDALKRDGEDVIREKYGNLFHMYQKITAEDPYHTPMRIYPAVHYTMGGLWVDYNLQSTIPGLFVLGEANFSDHGANRLGASALMQGLADGYFVIPYTVGDHLAKSDFPKVTVNHPAFKETMVDARDRTERILQVKGHKTVDALHRELGDIMWNKCGMARNAQGLGEAVGQIRQLRDEFWRSVKVLGTGEALNQNLEHAGRVADFMEFAELFAQDALHRQESCGGHFREEYQSEEGEAKRDDENFCYVAAWEHNGVGEDATLHKEHLEFKEVPLSTRSYK
jgi:succinate dehydrogenase / fumarate reductase flavoprotein subunit